MGVHNIDDVLQGEKKTFFNEWRKIIGKRKFASLILSRFPMFLRRIVTVLGCSQIN